MELEQGKKRAAVGQKLARIPCYHDRWRAVCLAGKTWRAVPGQSEVLHSISKFMVRSPRIP